MYTEKVRKQISKVTKNRFARLQLRGFCLVSVLFHCCLGVFTYLRIIWSIPVNNMLVLALLLIYPHTTRVIVVFINLCARAFRAFTVSNTARLPQFLDFLLRR